MDHRLSIHFSGGSIPVGYGIQFALDIIVVPQQILVTFDNPLPQTNVFQFLLINDYGDGPMHHLEADIYNSLAKYCERMTKGLC
jgi:hypothetical protein